MQGAEVARVELLHQRFFRQVVEVQLLPVAHLGADVGVLRRRGVAELEARKGGRAGRDQEGEQFVVGLGRLHEPVMFLRQQRSGAVVGLPRELGNPLGEPVRRSGLGRLVEHLVDAVDLLVDVRRRQGHAEVQAAEAFFARKQLVDRYPELTLVIGNPIVRVVFAPLGTEAHRTKVLLLAGPLHRQVGGEPRR